jgi:hypothetical protein
MANLIALLPAPEAQLIYDRLTTATQQLPTQDPRTLDQKRADLFIDATLSGLPLDGLPTVQGRRPAINVVVSADTLLNLDDQPGQLTGYGPITADTARRLAADQSGTWRRLLTDPDTGALLDISPHRYRPAQRTRDYLTARDGTCVLPDLPATGLPLRTRPHHPVQPGRPNDAEQPRPDLPTPQPSQSRHRLDLPPQPRRQLHLDHRNRPPLHRPTTLVTRRSRPQPTERSRQAGQLGR